MSIQMVERRVCDNCENELVCATCCSCGLDFCGRCAKTHNVDTEFDYTFLCSECRAAGSTVECVLFNKGKFVKILNE